MSDEDFTNSPSSRLRRGNGITETRILSSEYLNRHSTKSDLVRRLRNVVRDLANDDVEPENPDYPGLDGLAAALSQDRYLRHRDKEVRLQVALACMEIFQCYAPEPPWDETEILKIFPQIIRQLSNLAICTSPSQPNFPQYLKILKHFAEIKIGVVLVEMIKMLDSETRTHARRTTGSQSSQSSVTGGGGNGAPSSEDALEVLRELIEVTLNLVHIDHPAEVTALACEAVSACVDEFDGGVPIPILDEILKCVGAGSVVKVTNPEFVKASAALAAAKRKGGKNAGKKEQEDRKLPAREIQQTNQSYVVAKKVIGRTVDRISTPIANLLNGLMNGDPNVIKYSDISIDPPAPRTLKDKGTVTENMQEPEMNTANVWTIVYELHIISPHILTTVIGTVANSLTHSDEEKRLRVTKLLGKLFYSRNSEIGTDFHPCYREWIRRVKDASIKIRKTMVRHLLEILKNKANAVKICEEATEALVLLTSEDPSLEVRLQCIHEICDLVHRQSPYSSSTSSNPPPPFLSADLVNAVGRRVSAKVKKERLDSITGLARIYHKHYIMPKVAEVQDGGDNCDIEIILDTIHDNCDLSVYEVSADSQSSRRRKRKPSKSPMRMKRQPDPGDQNFKFISRLVFQSACITDAQDPVLRNRIIALVDDVILGMETHSSISKKGPKKQNMSPTARAVGLAMIINYLQTDEKENSAGQKTVVVQFMELLLNTRSRLQSAVRSYVEARTKAATLKNGTEEKLIANEVALQHLQNVATLTSPPSATTPKGEQVEDLETVLKKIHLAKDKHIFTLLKSISTPTHSTSARLRALDELPKRTKSSGTCASAWMKALARRTAMGHFVNSEIHTHCILLAQEAFNQNDFGVCRLFLESAKTALDIFPSISTKEGFETLFELFSECRESLPSDEKKQIKQYGVLNILSQMLPVVASSHTSPASNGPQSASPGDESEVVDDAQTKLLNLCTGDGTPEQARNAVFTLAKLGDTGSAKQSDIFQRLLKTLTLPTRLVIRSSSGFNKKIVNVLTALSALVECAPQFFLLDGTKNDRGAKAIRFALESVILGRGDEEEKDNETRPSDDEENEHESEKTPTGRRFVARKNSPKRKNLNANSPSQIQACQRLCVAIEFLVAHIRATILLKASSMPTGHISSVFAVLVGLIQDGGSPPSTRDSNECRGFRERAALRKCATVNLLRLCDGNLSLEKTHLKDDMWHILGGSFLDEESSVRDAAMNELSLMLTGAGIYRRAMPSLRFLAFVSLCPDSDGHNGTIVNGNAAMVGRRSTATKASALQCISTLRRTCETTLLQCRAKSREAEKMFEKKLKVLLMPEYAMPFVFHLLAFRPESPSCGLNKTPADKSDENWASTDDDNRQKMLRKRLKWLLEPLVQSLGEGADNISFLLRLSEILGRNYKPLVFSSDGIAGPSDILTRSGDDLQSRLKVICFAAREVLLKFVKKDVNLTPYPGKIQIPGDLFAPVKPPTPHKNIDTKGTPTESMPSSPQSTSRENIHVVARGSPQFDSDGDLSLSGSRDGAAGRKTRAFGGLKLNLSPIPQSRSPMSGSIVDTPGPNDSAVLVANESSLSSKKRDQDSAGATSSPDPKRRRSPPSPGREKNMDKTVVPEATQKIKKPIPRVTELKEYAKSPSSFEFESPGPSITVNLKNSAKAQSNVKPSRRKRTPPKPVKIKVGRTPQKGSEAKQSNSRHRSRRKKESSLDDNAENFVETADSSPEKNTKRNLKQAKQKAVNSSPSAAGRTTRSTLLSVETPTTSPIRRSSRLSKD